MVDPTVNLNEIAEQTRIIAGKLKWRDHAIACDDCGDGCHCYTGMELEQTTWRLMEATIAKATGS